MIKLYEFIYGVAFTIILGTALCADSMAAYPYGFRIMFVCIGVAVVLAVLGGRLRERDERIKKAARRGGALTGGGTSASADTSHAHYMGPERKNQDEKIPD